MGTNRGRPRGNPRTVRGSPSNSARSSSAVTSVFSSSSGTMIHVLACLVGSFLRNSRWTTAGGGAYRSHVATRMSSTKNAMVSALLYQYVPGSNVSVP